MFSKIQKFPEPSPNFAEEIIWSVPISRAGDCDPTGATESIDEGAMLPSTEDRVEKRGRELAEALCRVFLQHDREDRDGARAAQVEVDGGQFDHLDPEEVRRASVHFVEALWEKDAIEERHREGGELSTDGLVSADWGPVREPLERRAAVVGMDPEYAVLTATAWRRHKTGGDYWTPAQAAQVHEVRAALQDPGYPRKPRQGRDGFGPLAARYPLAIELHDMHTEHHWQLAREVMTPYFERILRARDSTREDDPHEA